MNVRENEKARKNVMKKIKIKRRMKKKGRTILDGRSSKPRNEKV